MQIRAARAKEKAAIVAFCKHVDPDDYVPEWIGRFLAQGTFFVLVDGPRIAGLVHGQLSHDGSAWMSAARIHEDYRGRGWINKLNDFALSSPELRSARAARMLITSDNASSIRAAKKGGYRVASRLSFVDWEAPSKRPHPTGRSSGYLPCAPEDFRRQASGSLVLGAQGGLAYMPFTGSFELSERAARSARKSLYRSARSGVMIASMYADTGERWLGVQPFVATNEVARRLVDFAGESRADSMTLILPALHRYTQPFLRAGYTRSKWAERVFVFEKRFALRAKPAKPSGARAAGARRRRAR